MLWCHRKLAVRAGSGLEEVTVKAVSTVFSLCYKIAWVLYKGLARFEVVCAGKSRSVNQLGALPHGFGNLGPLIVSVHLSLVLQKSYFSAFPRWVFLQSFLFSQDVSVSLFSLHGLTRLPGF